MTNLKAVSNLTHVSSHWQKYGALNTGYGTQRRLSPVDFLGVPLLALTSPDRLWVLKHLPRAVQVSRTMGLSFTQDSVRQLCTLALLRPYLERLPRVLLIGDGFGVLGGLVQDYCPSATVHMVDIEPALTEQKLRLGNRFTFVHASELESLSGRYDIAINVASMQEMDPEETARYFSFIRSHAGYFYCCNRESKTLPDGTISDFFKYPWSGHILLDELCPWHQWFVSKRGIQRYDGPTRHRLVRL